MRKKESKYLFSNFTKKMSSFSHDIYCLDIIKRISFENRLFNIKSKTKRIAIIAIILQRVVRTAERIIGTTHPLSNNCTYPQWTKGLAKSLWTPQIQHTLSSNGYHLVDATELRAPERPDTQTVSSLRQSISWTLDNNYGTHTIYTHIYLTHILSLHINCT